MPPVASQDKPFSETLRQLIAERTNGIGSWRELSKRMAAHKQTTVAGEKKSIRLHLGGGGAEEESLQAYATVFGIDRSRLPEKVEGRSKLDEVLARLEVLDGRLAKLEGRVAESVRLTRRALELLDDPPVVEAPRPRRRAKG